MSENPIHLLLACGRALRKSAPAILIALAAWAGHEAGGFRWLDTVLSDLRFEARSRAPTGKVVLVEIDAKSIDAVGQWPWPRSIHAGIVRKLSAFEASEVAFDVDFSSRSAETEDAAFEAALQDAGGSVILAAHLEASEQQGAEPVSVVPIERFAAHSWLGSVNVWPNPDGRVRQYPYGAIIGGQFVPSIPALLSAGHSGAGSFAVDFSIMASQIVRVSVADLLNGAVDPRQFAGRKVIVGASALALRDYFQVPVHGFISGALLQALAAETLMQGRALAPMAAATTALGLAILAVVFGLLLRFARWRTLLAAAALAALVVEGGAVVLQAWWSTTLPTAAWDLALGGFAAFAIAREMDLRRILLAISRTDGRNSKLLLNQIISDNLEGIVVVDRDGTIHSVSRAAVQVLYPSSAVNETWPGRAFAELAPPELVEALERAIADYHPQAWYSKRPKELVIRQADGDELTLEYVVTLSTFGGTDDQGRDTAGHIVACLIFRDISERRRAEVRLEEQRRELHKAKEAAEQASQAKSEFLATMSHEIRTPLNGILGFADFLQQEQLHERQQQYVRRIKDSGAALLSIVNDVLDFSKLEAGHLDFRKQVFSPTELVESTLAIVDGLARQSGLALNLEVPQPLPAAVVGDLDRLRQVLLNLLNNAIKFTPRGRVTLRVESQDGREAGTWGVRFSVADTGIGVPADKQHLLFQRFSQVDGALNRKFGGAGLGLAICKRIVESMGGEIGFHSEPGHGSTFWFTVDLPIDVPAPASLAQEVERSGDGRVRILLAEDNALNQEIARTVLEHAGYLVDVAGDGLAALKAVQAAPYDLIFMDIQMPHMDGITATRKIRALPPPVGNIPIIALTANVLPHQVESFLQAGMTGHVGKPFSKKDLFDAVDRCVNFRQEAHPPAQTNEGAVTFNEDAFRELVGIMGHDAIDALLDHLVKMLNAQLPASLPVDQLGKLGRDAHKLVSATGTLGFSKLSRLCRELEEACRNGEIAPSLLDEIKAARSQTLGQIAKLRGA